MDSIPGEKVRYPDHSDQKPESRKRVPVHLKKLVIDLLPQFVLNNLIARSDRKKLSGVPRMKCETTHLRTLSASQLSSIFHTGDTDGRWNEWSEKLDGFGIPDMTGGVNPGDRRALFYLVSALQPNRILEIGTHIGASTIHLAAGLESTTSPSDKDRAKELVSVDIADVNDEQTRPWLMHGTDRSPAQMIKALAIGFDVTFVPSPSLDFLSRTEQRYDMIFLDGDHSGANTYQEIPAAIDRLSPDGVVLLHDYFPDLKPLWKNGVVIPGPFQAVQRLLREGADIQVLPLGELPWPTKLGSNRTSLALLCAGSR